MAMMMWIYWDERSWFFTVRENEPPTSYRCEQVSFTPEELADYNQVMDAFEEWQTRLKEMAIASRDRREQP
jgi:hypothetical protein